MKINWKVRAKNKNFWISLIPAVLIFVQSAAHAAGVEIEISGISENLLSVINSLFAVLAILGIAADPTTKGIGDSEKALTYEEPF